MDFIVANTNLILPFIKGNNSYYFLAIFLGLSGGLIGTLTYQKQESLIGDALGHSMLPGIMIGFIVSKQKDSYLLPLFAIIIALISYVLLNLIKNTSKMHPETIMAIVLSSFFGFGLILYRAIMNSNKFKTNKQGLDRYIFGQFSYTTNKDILIFATIFLISCLTIFLINKELKIHLFDLNYSRVLNFSNTIISLLSIILTIVFIGFGIKIVGTILILAILISPATAAAQWTKRFSTFLITSTIIGAVGSFLATYYAVNNKKSTSVTASIIIFLCIIALFSIFFSPKGFFVRLYKILKAKANIKKLGGKA